MTFDDVFKQLAVIDSAASFLLDTAGSYPDEGLLGAALPLEDPAEDIFLREFTANLLNSLALFHRELAYLKSPVCGECRLEPFPDGRYGFFDKDGKRRSLSCGKTIEAKIRDRYGRIRWTRCRIEHDGSGYYLWGHPDITLNGLAVREREVAP